MLVITVRTRDRGWARRLFDAAAPVPGQRHTVAEGVSLVCSDIATRRGLMGTEVIVKFAVELVGQIALGVFTNWLYDFAKTSRARSVALNGEDVSAMNREELSKTVAREAVKPDNDAGAEGGAA